MGVPKLLPLDRIRFKLTNDPSVHNRVNSKNKFETLFRCEDYAISLLEQCEDLREVEIFLQTRNIGTKDANYILAILDAREKFVAHERFQYVLLKKFGK